MGRHSSEAQWPFIRSVIGWFLPWVLAGAVVIVGIWFGVNALSGDELSSAPTGAVSPDQTATRSPAAPAVLASASPSPSPSPQQTDATPAPEKTKKRKEAPEPELITEEITVQVLNGTGDAAADDAMADQLARLGYEVVAIGGSSKEYAQTTVFWSFPAAQEAAERLAAKFGWRAGPKPSNLSATVDLHVVVGLDRTT